MVNREIAALFNEMADLLELSGENQFKVRAYRRAAASLLALPDADALTRGDLQRLEGIGQALAEKIAEYLNTGQISALERLRRTIPPGLPALMRVPGIGPKLAARLYQELGVASVEDLQAAVQAHKLQGLKGLGPKTEANIMAGLLSLSQYRGRTPLYEALPVARELAAGLARVPGVEEAMVAGSIRRWRDMIGDVDIVVATTDSAAVSGYIMQLTAVERVLAQGDTKVSVVLHGGMQVDIRLVSPQAFASALHHSTGSREHNVQLRHLAHGRGLSISEYGLLDTATGQRIAPASEDELYRYLGLDFIPPELREGKGEIEAAAAHRLPALVTAADIKGDLHVHSNYSDGSATLSEIAREAARRGLDYVAVCDHTRALAVAGGLTPTELAERNRAIAAVNENGEGACLLAGVEVEILSDGTLDFPDDVLAQCDIVVAAIHSGLRQEPAQLQMRLIKAMENPHVDIIAHPTGRILGKRPGYAVDMQVLAQAAARTGTALEINASPHRLDLADENAHTAAAMGAMISINTDAHDLTELDFLPYGVAVARRAWLEPGNVLNSLSLPELRTYLARR